MRFTVPFLSLLISQAALSLILSLLLSSYSYGESFSEEPSQWQEYPSDLPQFDYSGDKLKQYWPQLSSTTGMPWPDASFIETMMSKLPLLAQQLQQRAKLNNAPAELKEVLKNNYHPLAVSVQQVWRLHYQGDYEQAYKLGMTLSPAGLFPAIYAKLIHATYLIKDHDKKEERFVEVDRILAKTLPLAQDYDFIIFGDAYQKARRLELMTTNAATTSGLLGPTQDKLKRLHTKFPRNPIYSAILAGIDAGIIERVGGFIGSITYGADEEESIKLFQQAIKAQPNLAVLYNEFSQAILRLDDSDYNELLLTLLNQCVNLTIYSAEEALNQRSCRHLLMQQNTQLQK
jgi:tetratricopeptide (TPR) repeat protein